MWISEARRPKPRTPGARARARSRTFPGAALLAALAAGCAPPPSTVAARPPAPVGAPDPSARVAAFAEIEREALGWLAAADPRLTARLHERAPPALLKKIGLEAVLSEDVTGQIRGDSLDLFAFRARTKALGEAAKLVAGFRSPLPDAGAPEAPLARPGLERTLLVRLIEEEAERARDEAKLGDASGDLVRGILSTWTAPATPQEWPDRDAWVSQHLLEIRDSLRAGRDQALDGPLDLDVALYPLERLLAPLEFPRGSAAIAEVRMAMDQDTRALPVLASPERIAHETRVHLGVSVDLPRLRSDLRATEERLRSDAERARDASGDARPALEARARELLFVEGPCPDALGTRVRAASPPPERAAICGALAALIEEPAAAILALHDDLLLALAAIDPAPPPRTRLLSTPPDERVDDMRRAARERPARALGVALAAQLLYDGGDAAARARTWAALGDAPLDVVATELERAK